MSDVKNLNFPEQFRYTIEHVWLCPTADEGEYLVGISDFAQNQLGEIAFVDLPAVDSMFEAGDEFGTVESLKSVNPLFMPVAAQVLAVNAELENTPTLVNISAYDQGWMLRIRPSSPADVQDLLKADAYRQSLS